MQLELSVQQFSNCLIVHVVGGMDLSNADLARIRLTSELDNAPDGVVLDLDRLEFLDAVGAQAIAAVQREADRRGVNLGVAAAPAAAVHVLAATSTVTISPSLADALEAAMR